MKLLLFLYIFSALRPDGHMAVSPNLRIFIWCQGVTDSAAYLSIVAYSIVTAKYAVEFHPDDPNFSASIYPFDETPTSKKWVIVSYFTPTLEDGTFDFNAPLDRYVSICFPYKKPGTVRGCRNREYRELYGKETEVAQK